MTANGLTKLIEIRLSALTRMEYMEVLEVPADCTPSELDELVNKRYQEVDGGEFTADPEYWKRSTCEAVDSDMPDAEASLRVSRSVFGLIVEPVALEGSSPATAPTAD